MAKYNTLTSVMLGGFLSFYALYAEALPYHGHTEVAKDVEYAYLIDVTHNKTLLDRQGHIQIPPASMSKIYTHLMLLERIDEGRLSLDDTFHVSEKAWRMGGSRTFLDLGSRPTVKDLMLGLAVQSGNDAAVTIAEGLYGTEAFFSLETTRRLQELGATNTVVKNASGWPHPEHRTTAHDLAIGAAHIIRNHFDHYWIFSEEEFTWNNITQKNRNPLLRDEDVDGMKTGWTSESGYGLIASAERDGRRLVGVIAGAKTPGARAQAMRELLNWGFVNFEEINPCHGIKREINVINGDERRIYAKISNDCPILIDRQFNRNDIYIDVVMESSVEAPITKGQEAGQVRVMIEDEVLESHAMLYSQDVERLGFFAQWWRKLGFD